MQLAKDLTELIHRFGPAMAAAAEAVLLPRHRPGDALPDLSALEECRSKNSGHALHVSAQSQPEARPSAL